MLDREYQLLKHVLSLSNESREFSVGGMSFELATELREMRKRGYFAKIYGAKWVITPMALDELYRHEQMNEQSAEDAAQQRRNQIVSFKHDVIVALIGAAVGAIVEWILLH